ncbi:reverse transcriptase domain-containing protein [Saccharicrinis fermentans]|uniref:Retron-type reverse transcriptase n=2 Tax=Saccharicrinis fermentans TaxID=982 RepID=W7YU72_9BACT|nr:reverse transcriptase domain-containing protein [Saccharicrinis fermentans]GAF06009.1 retron-type reverse transcriptase [Saccharicrinis fermentans DSM 9555 = JCM 21142]
MIVEKGIPMSSTKKVQKREKISQTKYFREKNAIAYCTKKEFLKNNINLIKSKNNKTGIPQGSPISATLANVYMLEFDELLFNKINEIGGYYQRYSDDLIVIYETRYEAEISDFILDLIKDLAKLEIHPKKTQTYRFRNIEKVNSCFHVDYLTKKESQNRKLEYLGFSYDGEKVLIKSSGFSKFYRSMKRSLKKSASLAINGKNPDNSIFKSSLYKRFTHRGAKRRLIYKPKKDNPKEYKPTKKYYWGNYISYINKANYSMRELNGDDSIKKQGRRFWNRFHLLLQFQVNRVNDKKSK